MNLQTISAAVILILLGICTLLFNAWQGANDEVTRIQSSLAQAQKQAEADAKQQRVEQDRILADTAKGWSAAVDWHRAHPRTIRVLSPAKCDLPQAGAVPAAPAEPDARPVEHGPGAVELTAEQCEARINAAVLDAAQVVWLRDFIQQQHEASK